MGPRHLRPVTTGELLTGFASSLRNLAGSCEQFSRQIDEVSARYSTPPGHPLSPPSYDLGPISEIAARLRKLLIRGRGDELFQRVCSATDTAVPTIRLTADAQVSRPSWDRILIEHFSMGAVPVDHEDGEPVAVTDIGARTCLAFLESNEQPVSYTWGQLVKDVGDKDGVHLDDHRPVIWDFINQYHAGDIPAIPLLFYRLAHAVATAGNVVLDSVGAAPVSVPAALPAAAMCGAMVVAETKERPGPRPGRNDRCPCESGLKFKRCCGP